MAMNMIDRGATAAAEAMRAGRSPGDQDVLITVARAVILSLREPSDGMVDAGYDARDASDDCPRYIYIAMIDAALAE